MIWHRLAQGQVSNNYKVSNLKNIIDGQKASFPGRLLNKLGRFAGQALYFYYWPHLNYLIFKMY